MVTAQVLPQHVAEFRQEAAVEERDGVLYLMLHGTNDNADSQFKRPFDPLNPTPGIDDGDPHYV